MADENDRIGGGSAHPKLWKYLPLAVILLAVGAVFATGLHRSLTFETFLRYQAQLRDMVAENRIAMLGLYVLVYVAAVTLSLPASAFLSAIGGYLFGWLVGGTAASFSATLGAASLFLIARTSLGRPLLRIAGSRIQSVAAGFQKRAFSYLLFLRLMPVVPFWLTNLAAAFFGMRLKSYVLATYLGMLPVCFSFAFAGSGLDEVVSQHERARQQCLAGGGADCAIAFSARSLLTPELLIALSVLGILALAPIAARYWRARKPA
ncbi:MAG TPA: TVP38/TMEM64 family protein [Microvirga sp.]|nr:TVP38/TMEM64 family protein [Microvirga sp.]